MSYSASAHSLAKFFFAALILLVAVPLLFGEETGTTGAGLGGEHLSGIPDAAAASENSSAAGTDGDLYRPREARYRLGIEMSGFVFILVFILCGILLCAMIRRIGDVIAESTAIRFDAAALVMGDLMPLEKKRRMVRVKKRMSGLRVKLAFFTIALVLAVEVMASAPLYFIMSRNQRQRLIDGLEERSMVMLEGLAAGARTYLAQGNIADMIFLPPQMVSIPEALYVTITGYNPETRVFGDEVWASNDPNILQKIDTAELIPGYSRLTDALSPRILATSGEFNATAKERAGGMLSNIAALDLELRELRERAQDSGSSAFASRMEEIGNTIVILENRISGVLARIADGIGSEPDYSPDNFVISPNHRYVFYKPVMSRIGTADNFFWGVVRLEISINPILAQMASEQESLLRINVLLALLALTFGIVGALILSVIIIRPIRMLVKHVEIIRDTEDKRELSDHRINLKSSDELAILGNTINGMTRNIVNAALAASDLSIGKEIQKKFLPLETDREGNKLSTGFEENMYFSLFGYYEGAKGVSGDYFDYQDLDGRYYALIKCDVAGKGIPASFIMIQVATMFLNYFRRWRPTEKGMHIEDLVYQINEFIENLMFKDRFAAFTLCLYDSHTGTTRFCNAGDNIIHLYDASEKKFKTLVLPETPAAGVLPNLVVESKGGYRVQTITLDHGDMLLLFTDGIEESTRKFRGAGFEEIQCGEEPHDTPHGNHMPGQWDEELGHDRVRDIVNAVMNKEIYTLRKYHNPEGEDKDLRFDFRTSRGTVEEVIMALISVEKMFRCYYNPASSGEDSVTVDKVVDTFLSQHFLQYRNYCSFSRGNPGNNSNMCYTHLMEDEQYDDLTILGIKRK